MKVRDFISVLTAMDPDGEVVIGFGDHEYRKASVAGEAEAEVSAHGHMSEYYGGQISAPNAIIAVLVIE